MRVLIIVQRNYGDAVILDNFLRKGIIKENYSIDVLVKSNYAKLFKNNPNVSNVYVEDFPIATSDIGCVCNQVKTIVRLRKMRLDIVLDYVGDFRERLLGWLLNPKKLVTVKRGNNFTKLVRGGLEFLTDEIIVLKDSLSNVYEQIEFILRKNGLKIFEHKDYLKNKKLQYIGIHPFASQECKMWQWCKWGCLIEKLLDDNKNVIVFGSTYEKLILEREFARFKDNELFSIYTESLDDFLLKLSQLDLLIGLDSLSIHSAYACGIRNIMICGGNDYNLWKTPLSTVVYASKGICMYWPCYNLPRCGGKYICLKSITVDDVYKRIYECVGNTYVV